MEAVGNVSGKEEFETFVSVRLELFIDESTLPNTFVSPDLNCTKVSGIEMSDGILSEEVMLSGATLCCEGLFLGTIMTVLLESESELSLFPDSDTGVIFLAFLLLRPCTFLSEGKSSITSERRGMHENGKSMFLCNILTCLSPDSFLTLKTGIFSKGFPMATYGCLCHRSASICLPFNPTFRIKTLSLMSKVDSRTLAS